MIKRLFLHVIIFNKAYADLLFKLYYKKKTDKVGMTALLQQFGRPLTLFRLNN